MGCGMRRGNDKKKKTRLPSLTVMLLESRGRVRAAIGIETSFVGVCDPRRAASRYASDGRTGDRRHRRHATIWREEQNNRQH